MHPIQSITHWSHHLHDSTLSMWYRTTEHLHSRQLQVGVGITLLIAALAALLYVVIKYGSTEIPGGNYPYVPYGF